MNLYLRTSLFLWLLCGLWGSFAWAQRSGENGNLPLPPDDVERRMERDPFAITEIDDAGGGVMGAKKVTLRFNDGVTFRAKWKESASGGDGWNNAPRREIAAYRIQEQFLDPDDYLIPPTVARCIPFETYRPISKSPSPTFDGTRCVFGSFSAWLQNVKEPEHAFDPNRFSEDPRYAYHFGNLNLLTYLIDHRDARRNNFLISKDERNPQIFSIDNGIAFGGVLYNFFMSHLDRIRVGGLPRRSVERLRALTAEDWQELAVVSELHVDRDGVLQPVHPNPPTLPSEGVRWAAGTLQLGLTTEEIHQVVERAHVLFDEIDHGKIALF